MLYRGYPISQSWVANVLIVVTTCYNSPSQIQETHNMIACQLISAKWISAHGKIWDDAFFRIQMKVTVDPAYGRSSSKSSGRRSSIPTACYQALLHPWVWDSSGGAVQNFAKNRVGFPHSELTPFLGPEKLLQLVGLLWNTICLLNPSHRSFSKFLWVSHSFSSASNLGCLDIYLNVHPIFTMVLSSFVDQCRFISWKKCWSHDRNFRRTSRTRLRRLRSLSTVWWIAQSFKARSGREKPWETQA